MRASAESLTDAEAYPDSMTLGEARALFFERASLPPDGGYSAKWVRVEAKPFPFYFPNTRGRVEAVKLHDLHHIATGYEGDWPGEAEIGAWEIAAGCGRYGQAWLLNLGAMTVGLFIAPRKVFRAFVAGRHAETLYHTGLSEDALATTTVRDLREQLRIGSASHPITAGDIAAFISWSLLGIGAHALLILAIGVFIYAILRARR